MSTPLDHPERDDLAARCEKNKGEVVRRTAREIAKAVLEHRLSEDTLDTTNVKSKL